MNAESKIKLVALETFSLEVRVPVLGGQSVAARFEMKARRTSEFQDWLAGSDKMTNRDLFDSIVVGWDISEPFTPDNVGRLLEIYPSAANAIGLAYVGEYNRVMYPK